MRQNVFDLATQPFDGNLKQITLLCKGKDHFEKKKKANHNTLSIETAVFNSSLEKNAIFFTAMHNSLKNKTVDDIFLSHHTLLISPFFIG